MRSRLAIVTGILAGFGLIGGALYLARKKASAGQAYSHAVRVRQWVGWNS